MHGLSPVYLSPADGQILSGPVVHRLSAAPGHPHPLRCILEKEIIKETLRDVQVG